MLSQWYIHNKWLLDLESSLDSLYSKGLKQLATELDQKYDLENISSMLYVLTINLYYLDSEAIDPNKKSVLYLLTDQNTMRREYRSSYGVLRMTFYLIAFHPAYRNFTSVGLL